MSDFSASGPHHDIEMEGATRYYALQEKFNNQLNVQREATGALASDVQGLKASVGGIFQKLDILAEKIEARGKPNVALLAVILPLVFGVVPGVWFVINNSISNALAPIAARLGQVETANTQENSRLAEVAQNATLTARDTAGLLRDTAGNSQAIQHLSDQTNKLADQSAGSIVADGVSKSDRAQLNDRTRVIETMLAAGAADRRNGFAEISARLLEVEQQFHAVSNISNMRWSDQNRLNAMTYEKLHPGETYPAQTFFPTDIFQSGTTALSAGTK